MQTDYSIDPAITTERVVLSTDIMETHRSAHFPGIMVLVPCATLLGYVVGQTQAEVTQEN